MDAKQFQPLNANNSGIMQELSVTIIGIIPSQIE